MSIRRSDNKQCESDLAKSRCINQPLIGIVEWFRPGEQERVEQVLRDVKELNVTELRTAVSWADCHTSEGDKWYSWLLPRLAKDINVLPCFVYTPPSLGLSPKSSSPLRNPKDYADFIDSMINRFGECFDWIELWNEPNNVREWDWTLDKDWLIFCEMIGGAAYWAKQKEKKTILGGMSPIDPNWLNVMFQRGVMEYIDAVGIHAFPDTFQYTWDGWESNVRRIRELLDARSSQAEVWITEVGYSTWRHNERRQIAEFVSAVEAPVERVYWYGAHDLDPALPTVDGFHSDEREYHFGLKRPDGSPKLLYRLWANEGVQGVKDFNQVNAPATYTKSGEPVTLITGGAGFIGTNLADRLLSLGKPVLIYDNLSRPGVENNLKWLQDKHGDRLSVEVADVRDYHTLRRCVARASGVFHFAAQVAVTTSLTDPINDFDINGRGTVNLLEAVRSCNLRIPVIFTSTNKVYGALEHIKLAKNGTRYEPESMSIRSRGVAEDCMLDFHSPYGCSKGSADQYIIDYSRTYDIPTAVFRMSCIYGPHQFGTEDQGWVAHFLIRAIDNQPISLYGDGMQVRDILFVEDLVNAFLLASKNIHRISGNAFNIGGGPANTTSLIELIRLIQELNSRKPAIRLDDWRVGDQRYYVSNTEKFRSAVGWEPRVGVDEGVRLLYEWLLNVRGIKASQVNKRAAKAPV